MIAYFLIVLGLLLRFLPHVPNTAPVAAIALFAGAYLNRKIMLEEVKKTFKHTFPDVKFITEEAVGQKLDGQIINIHHNFASLEHHFSRDLWIHRKGATQAKEGQIGIIPGSMGTASYIVRGLGNKRSMMSCSHGAGRKMGRRAFCRKMKYSHDQIEKSLEGVVHSEFGKFDGIRRSLTKQKYR